MWEIWVKNGLTCPPSGGSLVELAYEGVSSKFSCFLTLGRPVKARLVTSPHCAKKNFTGTLLKFLATTCWHHLAKGAKRETMLSEKRPNQHVKKYERLKNLIFSVSGARQWTCSWSAPHTWNSKTHHVFVATSTKQPQWNHLLGKIGKARMGWRWKQLKVKMCYFANWSEKCSRAIFVVFSGSSI